MATALRMCLKISTFYQLYNERYPGRRVPDVSVFDGDYLRLRETGSVSRRGTDLGRPRVIDVGEEQDNEIVERFRLDPTTFTNIVTRELGLSQWKVWFTVHTAACTHTITSRYKLSKKEITREGNTMCMVSWGVFPTDECE